MVCRFVFRALVLPRGTSPLIFRGEWIDGDFSRDCVWRPRFVPTDGSNLARKTELIWGSNLVPKKDPGLNQLLIQTGLKNPLPKCNSGFSWIRRVSA